VQKQIIIIFIACSNALMVSDTLSNFVRFSCSWEAKQFS